MMMMINDKHTDGEGQVLQVELECNEMWTMFDVGTDPFPPGAVMAGYGRNWVPSLRCESYTW